MAQFPPTEAIFTLYSPIFGWRREPAQRFASRVNVCSTWGTFKTAPQKPQFFSQRELTTEN